MCRTYEFLSSFSPKIDDSRIEGLHPVIRGHSLEQMVIVLENLEVYGEGCASAARSSHPKHFN